MFCASLLWVVVENFRYVNLDWYDCSSKGYRVLNFVNTDVSTQFDVLGFQSDV